MIAVMNVPMPSVVPRNAASGSSGDGARRSIATNAAARAADAISADTVTALDQFNNVATGYTGTVHFTSSDGQATLPTNYTFTGADKGKHTFTSAFTLFTAGSQSLTATDAATSTILGTQAGITVNPAAATTLIDADAARKAADKKAKTDKKAKAAPAAPVPKAEEKAAKSKNTEAATKDRGE